MAPLLRATVLGTGLSVLTAACDDLPAAGQSYASEHHRYRTVAVVDGLEHPWSLAFLPNGDMLVTERPGRLRIIQDGRLDPRPIAGVPDVYARGQGGLLDVVIHPDFESNRLVYLSFAKPTDPPTTAVIRGRLEEGRLADVEEILEADAFSGASVHFGCRMAFGRDAKLYVTIGERGEMEEAQNRSNHQGTTLRLNDDGSVPDDNPFVGERGVRPEIFTYGNRSPQGLVVHPETGELWQTEHGPRGGDELNLLVAGANYGWPVITYGINYSGTKITDLTEKAGMEQPVHYWVPSIATSGLAVYTGEAFPRWKGDFFVGGLAGSHLARVTVQDGRTVNVEKLLTEYGQRIRDVRDGPDGLLYVLVDHSRAPLLRLEPAG